ncbi:MAG: WecB/TagA/CpsF family glycosyltransferase [Deltaproteobacteria bacterium]|nr:WecB/TagA/CpsF family glycosyltransferase [Deltaproteobacteria bacterium]
MDTIQKKNGYYAVDKVYVGAAPIDRISKKTLLNCIEKKIKSPEQGYVCFCEAHLCVRAIFDDEIRFLLENASFVLPDGIAMQLGARMLGKPVPERLPGPSLLLDVCESGINKGYRHFFYGGAEGIAEKLADKLSVKYPGLQIAGTFCPPFRSLTESEDREIIERINQSKADIVWVGLGAPKQEKWMFDHLEKIEAPIMMGVGAAFDFHSGHKKWAPRWIRIIGLEWLYRIFTGGKRVFWRNLKHESMFVYLLVKQKIRLFFDRDFKY